MTVVDLGGVAGMKEMPQRKRGSVIGLWLSRRRPNFTLRRELHNALTPGLRSAMRNPLPRP